MVLGSASIGGGDVWSTGPHRVWLSVVLGFASSLAVCGPRVRIERCDVRSSDPHRVWRCVVLGSTSSVAICGPRVRVECGDVWSSAPHRVWRYVVLGFASSVAMCGPRRHIECADVWTSGFSTCDRDVLMISNRISSPVANMTYLVILYKVVF